MRYFRLMPDTRWINRVETEAVGEVQRREWNASFQEGGSDHTAINLSVKSRPNVDYTDYLERPVPLVSDRMLEVFTLYDPALIRRAAVLTDKARMSQETYWAIYPTTMDVLSPQTERHLDGNLKRIVLGRGRTALPLFQLKEPRESIIVVNLALAESLLRRDFAGIQLVRLEQEQTI
ncbi:hypothetical protein ACFTRD_30805 [Paenibacillus sp. NPDC056933]|uniref:hypothetical protein n=1 Tax=Paenibacillus sp. NPDC056933 TaxID=3345968 RepID=UPI00363C54C3